MLAVLGAVATLLMVLVIEPAEAQNSAASKIVFASNRTTGAGVDNPTGDLEIFSINPNGTGLKQITNNTVKDTQPTLSPDGSAIAYSSLDTTPDPNNDPTQDPDEEIYAISADGTGTPLNLTDNSSRDTALSDDSAPDWAPSGFKIAYTRLEPSSERLQIYQVRFTGTFFITEPLTNGITDLRPDYSPDGTKIAFTRLDLGQLDFEIFVTDADPNTNDTPFNLTNNSNGSQACFNNVPPNCVHDFRPRYSPDGTKIVYDSMGKSDSNPQGDFEVYVMNAQDGSGKKNLNRNKTDDFMPDWSPNGKKIVYNKLSSNTWAESGGGNRSPVSEPGKLFTMKPNGSNKTALKNTSKAFINQSPDWGNGS
jgi:Tol biopolymer transport system component